jgi:hypothetical protein
MTFAEGKKSRNHFKTKFNKIKDGDVYPEELEKIKQTKHFLPNYLSKIIEYIVRIAE